MHFVLYGHSWCFYSSQIALVCGSCNFENFKTITRAHISRNALAFIRFSILIYKTTFRSLRKEFLHSFRKTKKDIMTKIIYRVERFVSNILCKWFDAVAVKFQRHLLPCYWARDWMQKQQCMQPRSFRFCDTLSSIFGWKSIFYVSSKVEE